MTRRYRAAPPHGFSGPVFNADIGRKIDQAWPKIYDFRVCHSDRVHYIPHHVNTLGIINTLVVRYTLYHDVTA